MKLMPKKAPHIRSDVNNKTVMGDAVLALAALYFMAACYHGYRALHLCALSVAVCWAADLFCTLLRGRRVNLRDFSPAVTGMIIPLMMPANIPWHVVVTAGLFAILAVKQPFGGLGNNLFNPAAGGIAFATVCWTEEMFSYPVPGAGIDFFGPVSSTLSSSTAYTLYVGGVPMEDATSVLLGQLAGPMGTTSVLVILAGLFYLLIRGTVRYQQSLLILLTAGALNFLFPRVAADGLTSAFYEVLATPVLFCAVFMFADPVTSPGRNLGRALYGAAGGVVVFLFSRFGGYEQTTVFAILLMNAVSPAFDILAEKRAAKERRLRYGRQVSIALPQDEDFGGEDSAPDAP